MRKRRPPATYVHKLEGQINSIKKFITDLKSLEPEKQLEKLKETDLIELVNGPESSSSVPTDYTQTASQDLQDDVEENKVIYGPT